MAEDRANNPARRPNTPGMGDVWRAVSQGHITNEEGSALNSKWTTEKDYLANRSQVRSNISKSKRGDKNPMSHNNPAWATNRNNPASPTNKDRGK